MPSASARGFGDREQYGFGSFGSGGSQGGGQGLPAPDGDRVPGTPHGPSSGSFDGPLCADAVWAGIVSLSWFWLFLLVCF